MHCDVAIEVFAKHQQKGRPYEVRIDITVPGTEITISQDHRHEDVYVGIKDSFEVAYRKLQDYVNDRVDVAFLAHLSDRRTVIARSSGKGR